MNLKQKIMNLFKKKKNFNLKFNKRNNKQTKKDKQEKDQNYY